MLGLDPGRLVDGLIALDECTSARLLDAVIDYCKSCAEQYDGWAPFLDGGFALLVDGQTYARPTCCVDLREGVGDWIKLGPIWGPTWQPIESGHPGVLARIVGNAAHVSTQGDEFPDEIPVAIQIDADQLRRAVEAGTTEIYLFAGRLEARMRERDFDDATRLARPIAGLDSDDAPTTHFDRLRA